MRDYYLHLGEYFCSGVVEEAVLRRSCVQFLGSFEHLKSII